MKLHELGQGLVVSAFGIGCQVMCGENYGPADEDEGVATIRFALDLGVNFFDTSETYGHHRANEKLLGRAIRGRRHEAILCTKFGMQHQPNSDRYAVNSHPDIVAPSCDGSLRALGVDYIDLY